MFGGSGSGKTTLLARLAAHDDGGGSSSVQPGTTAAAGHVRMKGAPHLIISCCCTGSPPAVPAPGGRRHQHQTGRRPGCGAGGLRGRRQDCAGAEGDSEAVLVLREVSEREAGQLLQSPGAAEALAGADAAAFVFDSTSLASFRAAHQLMLAVTQVWCIPIL